MADGLNRWSGFGNLAEDAELKVLQGGAQVLKFTVACNESYKDKSDQRVERCEFVRCTLWGKRGEALAQYMKKGGKVYVEGSLRTTSYEKNGEKRYSTEINVANVILGGGGGGAANGNTRGSKPRPAPEPSSEPGDADESEIPF